MPLRDLFSKAPAPIPPSEEPWPKQPSVLQQQEVSSHSKGSCDYKRSPLYSVTSRPTLDEFLRTDYLMIPEFVMQVNRARKTVGLVENEHCFQNMTPQQSEVNVRDGTPTVFSADRNQAFSDDTKEAKDVEKEESTVKKFRSTTTEMADKVTAAFSARKQISSEEIHVPPPMKPKPRVKKVMKGGSLVTIPAPQPRNRTLNSVQESSEGINRATTSTIMPESSECRKNVVDTPERKSQGETLYEESIEETFGNQFGVGGDLNLTHEEDGDLQKEAPTKESKQLRSKVLTEKSEQKPVSLNSVQNTVGSCQNKNSKNDISDDGLQGPSSDTARIVASLKDKDSHILHSIDPQVVFNKEPSDVCDELLKDRSIKQSKLTSYELRSVVEKASIEEVKQDLIDDPTSSCKTLANQHGRQPGRKSSTCMIDSQERNINRESMGQADEGLGNSYAPLDPHIVTSKNCGIKETGELPHNLDIMTSSQEISNQNKKEGTFAKKSSESEATHAEKNHCDTTGDVEAIGITSDIDKKDGCGEDIGEIIDVNAEDITCNVVTAEINATERKTDDDDDDDDDGDTPGDDNSSANIHVDNDHDGIGDDNDDDEEEGGGGGGLDIKEKSAEESDKDYAELIMDDSNAEEDDEDYFIPGNGDESDEEEGEVISDYEPEDMMLGSDNESAVGGITFCQDTTLNKSRKHSRHKKREKRKTKNQKKKASKKRTKAEKQAAIERSRASLDPSSSAKSAIAKPPTAPISQAPKEGSKNLGPQTHKPSEILPKPQTETATAQNKPTGQSVSEEGSLLSMVSSYTVDVTVAASEKLALKKSRGGQHAKKLKKAKRKAAALERIRRGDPPPRPRRVQQPKALCNYYIQGKCRKGEECPFRHDKSAVVKKRELCKFYVSNSCLLGDGCIYMHNSFPCKFFHTGSTCWAAEQCKFSHDALTEETSQLLQLHLNPPVEDPVQSAQDSKPPNDDSETPGISRLIAGASTYTEDNLPASTSSPYNLRTSTRKRRLSTSEAGVGHVTDAKASRQESPQHDQEAKHEGQSSSFLPGLYKDLSM